MEEQSGLSELSVISWVSAVEGCPLSGVPLYRTQINECDWLLFVYHGTGRDGADAQYMQWFLLGTGRMPHPVGGAMGVTLFTALKRGYPALTLSH